MRKVISLLSVSLLLAIGAVQAKATTYTYPVSTTYNGYTIVGTFTLDLTANQMAFVGTATTPSGETYDINAEGDITGQAPRLTLSGSITISQGDLIIKQVTINQTASTEWAAIEAFIQKLLAALPQ